MKIRAHYLQYDVYIGSKKGTEDDPTGFFEIFIFNLSR